ncbi:ATP-binding protein [Klebsiella pneumoniae]|uniref:sensor histidine kinase n=1 Tax=Klebsiella pneumoniae TaxID=573 RepID=UPI001FADA502|nr:ATP-binding protein [Klebsiella pneumoniae]MCI8180052.1 ATP-binding protein [Klebsiella pneumoniae]WLE35765.1 ATP-binding protein [Klebsiella pneumoniae]
MNNENEIAKKLISLINEQDDSKDYGEILALATQLSFLDKENIRFTVDAKIVERLGEQLVAKKTTALSELIKNAYDADASQVLIEFNGTEEIGGIIEVHDDGHGMSIDDIQNSFMTISTSDKVNNPSSRKYNRAKAGKKGIGRFSAQKLGRKLELITKRKEEKFYTILNVDWDIFVSGKNIESIPNKITYTNEGFTFSHGTILRISGVREAWTLSNIKTAFNYISSILKVAVITESKNDPGFNVKFNYIDNNNTKSELQIDSNTEFLAYADLKATASIREDLKVEIKIEGMTDSRFTEVIHLDNNVDPALLDANYTFETYYFSLAKGTSKSKPLISFLYNNGGIKLYRNGFHVAPYGERYNDWLGLDESSRRRIILPPHSNTNFLGNVYVRDIRGSVFEETSSREGFIDNSHFKNLVDITTSIAIKIATHVASVREKKITASQKNYKPALRIKEEEIESKIDNIKEKLIVKENLTDNNQLGTLQNSIKSISVTNFTSDDLSTEKILEDIAEVKSTIQEYVDERLLYRVLASVGLAISEFTHEIQLCLLNLKLTSNSLTELAEKYIELKEPVDEFMDNLSMLVAYTDYFDGTLRSNSNKEKDNYDFRKLVKKFVHGMEPTIKRRGYEFRTNFDRWGIWTKKIHISEIMSIFMNLFTNSCKAIERAGQKNGVISINVQTFDKHMVIRFEDNGDGIPKNKWARVFEPLYTTSSPAPAYASDNQINRGMGLGLSITEEIINEMQGEISIIEPSTGFNTCVKIVLPLADEDELPEDAY